MQGVAAETGEERKPPEVARILALHACPVRLELLGLVVRIDETALAVEAEIGVGQPLGTVAGEAVRLLGHLDLGPAIDEFTSQAGGTLRSFARLASGKKWLQGAEAGRILAVMAGQRIKAGLSHAVHRRDEQTLDTPA